MERADKIKLLEETLDIVKGTLEEETILKNVDNYDSIGVLGIIVMFEDEFGIKLERADFNSFVKVKDIIDRMQEN